VVDVMPVVVAADAPVATTSAEAPAWME